MTDLQHLLRGVIIALLLLSPPLLWAAEPAGYVLMAIGDVVAVQSDDEARPLERRSAFYPGESLKTGSDSKAQVRFRDGSLISMRPDTEIRIDEFRYQEDDKGEDRNIFTLINGGFRTITGKIGKKNPDNYRMKSSVASIGVRGTHYEVYLDGGMDVAVWNGTIVVENQAGDITLGAQGAFNFAHVTGATTAPQGSLKPPAGFSPEPGPEVQREGDKGDGPVKLTQEPVLPPFQDPTVNPGDLRLQGVTLNRVGLAIESNALAGSHHRGGKAAAADPMIAANGLFPGDASFDSATITDVIIQGGATQLNRFDDPAYPISWGIWSGATVQTDPDDLQMTTAITDPVVWMTVQPTADAVLAGLSGGGYYHSAPLSPATQGISNGGMGITGLNADLELDFDTALFKGRLSLVTNPSDVWNLSFDGSLIGPRLEVTGMTGSYSGAGGSGAATGDLFMVLTGANPDAIAGGFDLEYAADPNFYVQGNFIAERDLRLSFSEAAAMDRVALGAVGSVGANVTFVGRSTSGASGSPVIALSGFTDSTQADFWLQEANDILRQDTAPDLVTTQSTTAYQVVGTPDPAYEVSWGAWNGQASAYKKQTDPIDPTVSTAENSDLFWITFQPASAGAIAGRSGQITYDQTAANWVVGSTSAGAIDGGTFGFSATVDFDTGAVSGGSMVFSDTAANYWNVASFSGTLNGPELQISSPLVYYNSDSINPAAAEIKAVLTGPKAEGVAGSFDFDYLSGTATAEGVFLANCAGNAGC